MSTEVLYLSPVVLSNTRWSWSLQMQTGAGRRLVMELWTDQGAYSWSLIQLSTRRIITSLTKPDWLLYIFFLLLFIHCFYLPPHPHPVFPYSNLVFSSHLPVHLDITLTSSRFFCTSLFWWPLTFEPVTTPDMSDTAATVSCTSLPIMNLNVSRGHHFGDRVVFNEPTSSNHTTSYLADWGAGAYFMSG